jgi:transposase-like protein
VRDEDRWSIAAGYEVTSSKYLNSPIDQDHRGMKFRIGQMLGFNWSGIAAIVIAGSELLRRIYKGQFNLGVLRLKDRNALAVWNAVLAAQ